MKSVRLAAPALMSLLLLLLSAPLLLAQEADEPRQTARIRRAMRTVTLMGYTRAMRTMTVTSEVSARCIKVFADVGEGVPSSSILARLDTTFVDINLRQTGAGIKQAKSRIRYLKTETSRSRELVKRETQAQTHLDLQEHNLEQARFKLEQLEADQKRLEEQKIRHTLKGPQGWTVIKRSIEPGEWVAASSPVFTLGDFRTLRIPLALTPEEFAALSCQSSLFLRLPLAGKGVLKQSVKVPRKLAATLFRIAPDFDPVTRKYQVELLIRPPQKLRRGGLRCELDLHIPEPVGTYEVPERAVFERYETHWVTTKDGAEVKVILLGTRDGISKISSPGLHEGDIVQVRP